MATWLEFRGVFFRFFFFFFFFSFFLKPGHSLAGFAHIPVDFRQLTRKRGGGGKGEISGGAVIIKKKTNKKTNHPASHQYPVLLFQH